MNSYYRIGTGVPSWTSTLPEEGRVRIQNLSVGAELWKTAENRFYELGISPSKMSRRDITGIKPVDQVSNILLDFLHIGILLLGASAIHTAVT